MEKIDENQLKREFAFDQYGRYAIIRNIINANRKKGEKFRVLDVGGRGNIMRKFLPYDNVFYLDPYADIKDDNYIEGNGCAIPLESNSFDWIVSGDTFEHIPPEKREKFLTENIRVAKLGAIIAAPFYSKEVVKAEENINNSCKILGGGEGNSWLEEHKKYGLPRENFVESLLKKNNFAFQKISHNNILLWELYIGITLNFLELRAEELTEKYEDFNYFYNSEVFLRDLEEPAYRKIYFIKKNKKLRDLKIENKKPDNSLFLQIIKESLDLTSSINRNKSELLQKNAQDATQKSQIILGLEQTIKQREQIIKQQEQAAKQQEQIIKQQEQKISLSEQAVKEKEREIQNLIAELNYIKSSKFWKIRNRYLKAKRFNSQEIFSILKESKRVLKEKGAKRFIWCIPKYLLYGKDYFKGEPESISAYDAWIQKNENWDIKKIKEKIKNFKYKPKISIITPVYNVDPKWLDRCINSVKNQFYSNWELCLHDDASTNKKTFECLKKWKKIGDKRIKISFGKKNEHISGASNKALEMATGEFVALLDNDDELSPDALFENVKVLNKNSALDFIYSDEDKIETDGKRGEPFFKPDWSLHWFLSTMYTCHLGVYRKTIINKIGGFRKGYEGAQDYDLVLRFLDKTRGRNIFHIPKILYHWRKIEGSTACRTDSKNYALDVARKAISDYTVRNNIKAKVKNGIFVGSYRIKRDLVSHPLVSIIIPTKDKADYLKPCILSILNETAYPNFKIVVLDTGSEENETKKFYQEIKKEKLVKIIDYPNPEFNFAEANTWAASKVKGDYFLFLNNDTEVINRDWLSAMMEYAQLENVGVVGSKLLFPNNTLQHMGVIIGLRGGASHAGICFPEWQLMGHPFLHAKDVVRNVSAVTGACLLIKKDLFEKVGGFDKHFKIAFNDTDLCLKVAALGYEIIYTPYAKLIHYESITFGRPYENPLRSTQFFEKERDAFNKKWKLLGFEDPYYNKNLTLENESLSIKA